MRAGGNFMAGYFAMLVPALLVFFGLVTAIGVGWRNWFGLGTKFKKKEKPPEPRRLPPRLRPRPDRE